MANLQVKSDRGDQEAEHLVEDTGGVLLVHISAGGCPFQLRLSHCPLSRNTRLDKKEGI